MAKIKAFSEDLYMILNKAGNQSRKYYQTFCGTSHLFLATFSFLVSNKDNSRYKATYDGLKEILNSYGIDGKKFEASFLQFCPRGEEPAENEEFKITPDREYQNITEALQRNAVQQKRSMEVEDLIMELFKDRSYSIFTIFSDIVGSDQKTDEMYSVVLNKFKKQVAPEIKELEEVSELTNLNKWLAKNPQKVVDGEEDVMKIQMALSGRSIKNCLLTGKAGTGKTTLVYEFVQQILRGECPEQFADKIVYELDTAKLVSGTRYRGDMEEKLTNILDVVKENQNVVLFIDELHSFLKAGASSDDANGAGQLLKPYITRGEVQLIAATTAEEYTKHILPDKAFASRFHEVKVEEPTKEATKQILMGLLPVETEFFKKEIQLDLLDKVIELSDKYALDQANPRKAINMLELACAYSRVFEEKNQIVDVKDVINSVKLRYNIYISENKLEDTKEGFKELLGQDEALKQVLRNLEIVDAEIIDIQRPALSMLFAGSSGTGKTRSAEIIAKCFFGSEDNVVKVNMGEYSTEQDVTKLTGSSAGYVGYDDEPQLIKGVREKPNSVILFDEIEKAHKSVQKIILNILDKGEMTDNKGNRISFRNNIIIFTTNLGCTHETGKAQGIGLVKTTVGSGKNDIMKAIKNYFSPEFLGRLDDIVFYNSLTKDVLNTLVDRYFKEYTERSTREEIKNLVLSTEDREEIFKEANVETQGARGVRKAVQKKIAELYHKIREAQKVDNATDF